MHYKIEIQQFEGCFVHDEALKSSNFAHTKTDTRTLG